MFFPTESAGKQIPKLLKYIIGESLMPRLKTDIPIEIEYEADKGSFADGVPESLSIISISINGKELSYATSRAINFEMDGWPEKIAWENLREQQEASEENLLHPLIEDVCNGLRYRRGLCRINP